MKPANLQLRKNSPRTILWHLLFHIIAYLLGICNRYAEIKPSCELHNFRIFTVYYATVARNQAVNIVDIHVHCTNKNIPNYCCGKQTVPYQENYSGAKIGFETFALRNGTFFTRRSQQSMWRNVLKPTTSHLLRAAGFKPPSSSQ